MNSTRRTFLKQLGIGAASAVAGGTLLSRALAAWPAPGDETDEDILSRKFALAADQKMAVHHIGDVMTLIGLSFIGTPYVAHTLEGSGPEHLVVNLRGLDCTTFVENVLALARCVKLDTRTFDAFSAQLRLIRYRTGTIDGYPSRLHYFSDWISDNVRKGIVHDVTAELGGVPLRKRIDFMTTHRQAYAQLADAGNVEAIARVEDRLSHEQFSYIPKARVAAAEPHLRSGDIIAITTSIPGLDVTHTGLVFAAEKEIRYLHAPLSGGAVQVSKGSLAKYLAGPGKQTGIMVARPLEPVAH